jgi:hypothetical protein
LSSCSCDGFSYSCGTSNRTIRRSYDGQGRVRSLVVEYTSGRRVSCNYTYGGLGCRSGSCSDNTGASCGW